MSIRLIRKGDFCDASHLGKVHALDALAAQCRPHGRLRTRLAGANDQLDYLVCLDCFARHLLLAAVMGARVDAGDGYRWCFFGGRAVWENWFGGLDGPNLCWYRFMYVNQCAICDGLVNAEVLNLAVYSHRGSDLRLSWPDKAFQSPW